MFVIPAIDIMEGKCVRLTQGDYSQKKVYHEDPLEVAKQFEDAGLVRVHVVDLDGAKAQRIVNHKILEKIAAHTRLHIDFGGGLKSDDDLRIAFECGAKQITGGTIAVKKPEMFLQWLKVYGPEAIILGADFKEGYIAVSGWQEQSERELLDFLKEFVQKGIHYTICTDISKDGLLKGASLQQYAGIREQLPDLQLIASGGVANLNDLAALDKIGCFGAVVGKAIYEGNILLKDLTRLYAS